MVAEHRLPLEELRLYFDQLSTAPDKGKALEEFCVFFFGSIPGVEVYERRVLATKDR